MASQRICTIEGCGNKHFARTWCRIHYYRWVRQGDPNARKIVHGSVRKFIDDVALAHVGDECLPWPFCRNGCGYGEVNRRIYGSGSASRVVCEAAHGPPPTPRHEAAHSCGRGNHGCVNPRHLRWATPKENQADKVAHGTAPRGENGAAKLTAEQVRSIRREAASQGPSALGRKYGVNESTIRQILYGKNWTHLT